MLTAQNDKWTLLRYLHEIREEYERVEPGVFKTPDPKFEKLLKVVEALVTRLD